MLEKRHTRRGTYDGEGTRICARRVEGEAAQERRRRLLGFLPEPGAKAQTRQADPRNAKRQGEKAVAGPAIRPSKSAGQNQGDSRGARRGELAELRHRLAAWNRREPYRGEGQQRTRNVGIAN